MPEDVTAVSGNCLKDYIGLKGFHEGDTAPASGLYINQLPGFTLESISKISEREKVASETNSFIGLWNDVQDRSWIRLTKDFKRAMRKCFSLHVDTDYSLFICENQADFADVWWYLLGAELMLERAYTSRMNRYSTIDRESAVELKDHYNTEYAKALKEAVDAIKIPEDEHLDCNPSITVVESLP